MSCTLDIVSNMSKYNECCSILGNSVVPIECSLDESDRYQPVVERYFTSRYCMDIGMEFGDYCILLHSNRVCVITLAPWHALLSSGKQVVSIDFQASKNVDRLSNRVSGKLKRGAQYLKQPSERLFTAVCSDGTTFNLCPGICGKLVEVNDQLIANPNLLVTDPGGSGFLGCVIPSIANFEQYRDGLLTKEKYYNAREVVENV